MLRSLLMVGFLLAALPPGNNPVEVAVIVHASNKVTSMDAAAVRSLFLLETSTWESGKRVKPVDLGADNRTRQVFLARVLRLSRDELGAYWTQARYANGTPPPPRLWSEREMIQYVAAFDGALGYVDANALTAADLQKVRVVLRVRDK